MEILIPASLGELADKITILQIKVGKPFSKGARKNIQRELSLLEKRLEEIEALWSEGEKTSFKENAFKLASINGVLWDVEDRLRLLERDKDFGDEFISLARQVYYLNDERSHVKKSINLNHGSTVTEEKLYEEYHA